MIDRNSRNAVGANVYDGQPIKRVDANGQAGLAFRRTGPLPWKRKGCYSPTVFPPFGGVHSFHPRPRELDGCQEGIPKVVWSGRPDDSTLTDHGRRCLLCILLCLWTKPKHTFRRTEAKLKPRHQASAVGLDQGRRKTRLPANPEPESSARDPKRYVNKSPL